MVICGSWIYRIYRAWGTTSCRKSIEVLSEKSKALEPFYERQKQGLETWINVIERVKNDVKKRF